MDSHDERDQTEGLDTGRPIMDDDRTLDVDTVEGLSVLEAAAATGVSEKTIRRWIVSGRLPAVKLGGQYRIARAELERARSERAGPGGAPPKVTDDQTPDDIGGQTRETTGHPIEQRTQASAVTDLAPLAAVIERQHETIERQAHENRQLAEAAAVWQFRAMQAEERLKALTAGETAQEVPSTSSGEPGTPEEQEPPPDTPSPVRSWWRRLWGGA